MDQATFLRTSAARLRRIAAIAPASPISRELLDMAESLEREADQLEQQGSPESKTDQVARELERLAVDFDDIAEDIERGAIEIIRSGLLPQRNRSVSP